MDGSILYYRVGIVNDNEVPPRHANADIERTRLAVASRRRENSHPLSVIPATGDAEGGPPRDSDAVIGRVVVDEYEFEVRIAAQQGAANALPNGGQFVSPGGHHGNERFACPGRADSGGRTRAGFARYASHTMTGGNTNNPTGSTTSNHHDGSTEVISFGNARENPRFDMGSSADRK